MGPSRPISQHATKQLLQLRNILDDVPYKEEYPLADLDAKIQIVRHLETLWLHETERITDAFRQGTPCCTETEHTGAAVAEEKGYYFDDNLTLDTPLSAERKLQEQVEFALPQPGDFFPWPMLGDPVSYLVLYINKLVLDTEIAIGNWIYTQFYNPLAATNPIRRPSRGAEDEMCTLDIGSRIKKEKEMLKEQLNDAKEKLLTGTLMRTFIDEVSSPPTEQSATIAQYGFNHTLDEDGSLKGSAVKPGEIGIAHFAKIPDSNLLLKTGMKLVREETADLRSELSKSEATNLDMAAKVASLSSTIEELNAKQIKMTAEYEQEMNMLRSQLHGLLRQNQELKLELDHSQSTGGGHPAASPTSSSSGSKGTVFMSPPTEKPQETVQLPPTPMQEKNVPNASPLEHKESRVETGGIGTPRKTPTLQ
ncbi:unnamed protein product [Amoebophrya sp. A120]|nr:unnamed protein product [Amoebophrya sp. A120]|eukprot:GSA120T00019747001.1